MDEANNKPELQTQLSPWQLFSDIYTVLFWWHCPFNPRSAWWQHDSKKRSLNKDGRNVWAVIRAAEDGVWGSGRALHHCCVASAAANLCTELGNQVINKLRDTSKLSTKSRDAASVHLHSTVGAAAGTQSHTALQQEYGEITGNAISAVHRTHAE